MIRRPRIPGYGRSNVGAVDDTDALQTDVMRFMSILGLCLMAVFALVQSLPLHDNAEEASERSRMQERIAEQQRRLQALDVELQALLANIEQTTTQQADRSQALSLAERRLTEVVDQTKQARNEQRRILDELGVLKQRLESGRKAHAELQQTIDDKAESLQTMQRRLDREAQALDEIRAASRGLKRQQTEERRLAVRAAQLQISDSDVSVESKPIAKRSRPSASSKLPTAPNKKQKGFTLRFASDTALRQLIASGEVRLFAMLDRQAWRIKQPGANTRRPVVVATEFPSWFHEMAAATVPVDYVKQLRTVVDQDGTVVWGVQLPASTRRDIRRLTRGHEDQPSGGNLLITANGQVRLDRE